MEPTVKPTSGDTPWHRMTPHPARAGWGLLTLLLMAGCGQVTPAADAMVNVLGQDIAIHYGVEVTDDSRTTVTKTLSSAADLLDRHANDLDTDQKRAIAQIRQMYVTQVPKACLGQTGPHAMTLSIDYIQTASTPWLASLIGHEGQHFLDAGKYVGADAWKDEQKAGLVQLGIGKKIGFSASEIKYLDDWTRSGQNTAMQTHMKQGYPRNCDTEAR